MAGPGASEFGFEKAGDFGLVPGGGTGFCFFEVGLMALEKFDALFFALRTSHFARRSAPMVAVGHRGRAERDSE